MTPFQVKAIAIALIAIVALMWVLSAIEFRRKRHMTRIPERDIDSDSDPG